jgi:hypothetical protein
MEAVCIETDSFFESRPAENRHIASRYRYQSFTTKVLEDAIDMHDRNPNGIAEFPTTRMTSRRKTMPQLALHGRATWARRTENDRVATD